MVLVAVLVTVVEMKHFVPKKNSPTSAKLKLPHLKAN